MFNGFHGLFMSFFLVRLHEALPGLRLRAPHKVRAVTHVPKKERRGDGNRQHEDDS